MLCACGYIHRVGRHAKYRLPDPPRRRGGAFLWLVILAMLAAASWLWWRSANTGGSPLQHQPALAARRTNEPTTVSSSPALVGPPANRPLTSSPSPGDRVESPGGFPRPARGILEAQLALERQCISPGLLDGVMGSQTRAAFRAVARKEGWPEGAELDATARARLLLDTAPFTTYTVTSNDLARLQPLGKTWLAKSQQTALDYETILELVAEKARSHPDLIRRLNPGVDWTRVVTGTQVRIPGAVRPEPLDKAAFIVISLGEKRLEAFGLTTNLLAHFPCSIAARVEKRPAGELRVAVIAPNPNYTFDPEVFPESEEARQLNTKLVLPPGPNNPVGVVWIGLDKPGYGIHGTPSPELVGRTESHGCFRLANWNAEYLLKLVWIGMPVFVEP